MRKIAIANRKGGVGKTTTAVNLAHGLSLSGSKVLLIDTDTQGHCSRLLGVDPERGLAELIDGICTSSEALIEARESLFLLAGSKKLELTIKDISQRTYRVEYVLADALKPYEGKFNYVIVDTSPGFSQLNINVFFYVQEVLVPVSMEVLALDGFKDFLNEIEVIGQYTGVEIRYIVPTFYDRRVSKSEEILGQLQKRFGDLVTRPVRYSTRLSEAPAWGQTIYEFAGKEKVSKDYSYLSVVIS